MKKIIAFTIFTFIAFFGLNPVFAGTGRNKVAVESLDDFSFNHQVDTVKLKVLEKNKFQNGVKFEKDAIITAKVAKVVDPKRGKRNGYLVVDPLSYTVPSSGAVVKLEDEYWFANVVGYKPFDAKSAAAKAGLSVAGFFVKGIGQIFYFGKGVISPEDGENRLKSGAKSVYENSPLAYIEEGEEVDIKTGDIMLLKFYYEDVPKWKFWERNK